jgi:hypothetical protein
MNNCCIVINTCKQYYSNIKDLIRQINEYNFPKQNILIISGQEDIEETFFEDNIKVIRVRYTGLQLTGMIYINEHIELYDHIKYWVFLPDTIKFGKNFYSLLTKYYNEYLQKGDILSLGFISPCLYFYKDTITYSKNISYLKITLNFLKKLNVKYYRRWEFLELTNCSLSKFQIGAIHNEIVNWEDLFSQRHVLLKSKINALRQLGYRDGFEGEEAILAGTLLPAVLIGNQELENFTKNSLTLNRINVKNTPYRVRILPVWTFFK